MNESKGSVPLSLSLLVMTGVVLAYTIENSELPVTTLNQFTYSPSSQLAAVSEAGSGLVAYYSFDGGNATDSSGRGNNGTISGATPASGRIGGAMSFDGVDDYIDLGAIGNLGSSLGNGFTYSAWVYQNNSTPAGLFSTRRSTENVIRLGINRGAYFGTGVGRLAVRLTDNNGLRIQGSTSGQAFLLNQWNHIVFTISPLNNEVGIYVNGVSQPVAYNHQETPSSFSNFTRTIIGADQNLGLSGFQNGSQDDVRIYNRVLSASEVSELYAYAGGGGLVTGKGAESSTPAEDTTAPVISAVSASNITATGVSISWSTNESTNAQVDYGRTTSYGSNTVLSSILDTTHTQSISNLTPNTIYNYRVKSRDASGNLATSGNFTFSTLQSPSTLIPPPPVLSGSYVCGNNITEPGEVCDGADVNGLSCTSVATGFKSGPISCAADCRSYVVDRCAVGNTVNAASCSREHVQAAINSAVDGDTVTIPAGTCSWQPLSQSGGGAVIIKNKNLHLRGAGMGNTIINLINAPAWGNYALGVYNGGKPVRVSHMTFSGEGNFAYVHIDDSMNFRADHLNNIIDTANPPRLISIRGLSYGVVDNIVKDTSVASGGILIRQLDNSAKLTGNLGFLRPYVLGTGDAVFFEDSQFASNGPSRNNGIDGENGASVVFRHNSVRNSSLGTHGLQSSGGRSIFSWEVYNNQFTHDINGYLVHIWPRGGTGVIYNNLFQGTVGGSRNGYYIGVDNPRTHTPYGSFGKCDGTNQWDGNQDSSGYPCADQIGRATGNPGNQVLEPAYEWNNFVNGTGANVNITVLNPTVNNPHIVEGRDFYNDKQKPGYVPYPYPHPIRLIDDLGQTGGGISQPAPTSTQIPSTPIPAPSTKFQNNSRVQVINGPVTVRSAAGTSLLGQQPTGSIGTVIRGGVSATLFGVAYNWWNVNFDSGVDGWVAENFLSVYTASPSAPVTQLKTPRVSDFNKDGVVNATDFSMMRLRWNTADPIYDLNGDGVVNSLDASILISNFN